MRHSMGRLSAAAALAFALALLIQTPGSAQLGPTVHGAEITVTNNADICAWITIYKAIPLGPWAQEKSPRSEPQYVAPGRSHTFRAVIPTAMKLPTEIKVRAEMVNTTDCSRRANRIADIDQVMKGLEPRNPAYAMGFAATVSGSKGRYSISLHRTGN